MRATGASWVWTGARSIGVQPSAASAASGSDPSSTTASGGRSWRALNAWARSSASGSGTPGSPIASAEFARRRGRPSTGGAARSTQSPSVLDGHVGPERDDVAVHLQRAHPLPHRRPWRDRLARHDEPHRDGHRGPRLGLHDALAVGPPHTGAEHVGHGRTAGRTGLAGHPAAYDDTRADDVGTQLVGRSVGRSVGWAIAGHLGILGWILQQQPRRLQEVLVTYVIAQPCVDLKDRACVDECPVDCIYEGKRMLYIHPDECVDCGACEPVCPVEAIFYEDDTPEEWKSYYDANVHFFDDIGSPGGAAKMGDIDHDHEVVSALPPQEHDE